MFLTTFHSKVNKREIERERERFNLQKKIFFSKIYFLFRIH